jgi:hypothetical protein
MRELAARKDTLRLLGQVTVGDAAQGTEAKRALGEIPLPCFSAYPAPNQPCGPGKGSKSPAMDLGLCWNKEEERWLTPIMTWQPTSHKWEQHEATHLA